MQRDDLKSTTLKLVRAFYDRVWNSGETSAAVKLLAEDFVFRGLRGAENWIPRERDRVTVAMQPAHRAIRQVDHVSGLSDCTVGSLPASNNAADRRRHALTRGSPAPLQADSPFRVGRHGHSHYKWVGAAEESDHGAADRE